MNCVKTTRYLGYDIRLDHLTDLMWVEHKGVRVVPDCLDLDHAKRCIRALKLGQPLPTGAW